MTTFWCDCWSARNATWEVHVCLAGQSSFSFSNAIHSVGASLNCWKTWRPVEDLWIFHMFFRQRTRATETRSFSESDWCRMPFCFAFELIFRMFLLRPVRSKSSRTCRIIVVVLCLGSGCLLHPKNSRVHFFWVTFFETKPANCRSDVAEERQDPTSEKLMFTKISSNGSRIKVSTKGRQWNLTRKKTWHWSFCKWFKWPCSIHQRMSLQQKRIAVKHVKQEWCWSRLITVSTLLPYVNTSGRPSRAIN